MNSNVDSRQQDLVVLLDAVPILTACASEPFVIAPATSHCVVSAR
jgi:hypothetical protein